MGYKIVYYSIIIYTILCLSLLASSLLVIIWRRMEHFRFRLLQWSLKKWNTFFLMKKSTRTIIFFICVAIVVTMFYHFIYFILGDSSTMNHLHEEALSNIRSNRILFGVALFGICLATWARVVSQEQLEKSIQMNHNERFAKAAEMLGSVKNTISSRGGLYILQGLILENPKDEYIRCVEVISYWILEDKNRRADIADADRYLSIVVAQILKIRSSHKDLEDIIKKYKYDNNLGHWPFLKSAKLRGTVLTDANLQGASLPEVDLREARLMDVNLRGARLRKTKLQGASLQNADLRGAYLQGAYLQGADLYGAKLDGADLTNVNMRNAKGLTKDNIKSTIWFINFLDDNYDMNSNGKPPKLPDYLMEDDEMKEWLKKDSDGIIFKPNK